MYLAYLGYLTDWTDITLWVSDAFHEYGLGILVDSRSKGRGVIRGDKLSRNAVFLQKHYTNRQLGPHIHVYL